VSVNFTNNLIWGVGSRAKRSSVTEAVAAVYAKPMGRPLVDTFVTEVSQDTWIFFPWDTGLAFQPPIRDGAAWSRRGAERRSMPMSDPDDLFGDDPEVDKFV
jgi:hypothetical protein